jgi:hypothetical protein
MVAIPVTDAPTPARVLREKLTTYHHVLIALRYVVLAHIVVGSFLVLAFCTPAGILGALVVVAIELAVGLALARDRKRPTWLSEFATLFISTSADSGHT